MTPKFSRAAEFERWLESRGWTFVRNGGRHKIWRAPNGHRMPSSKGNHANRNIVNNALRIEKLPPVEDAELTSPSGDRQASGSRDP